MVLFKGIIVYGTPFPPARYSCMHYGECQEFFMLMIFIHEMLE